MNGFIFGFQRLVWWPKCTPASKSSGTNSTVFAIQNATAREGSGGRGRCYRYAPAATAISLLVLRFERGCARSETVDESQRSQGEAGRGGGEAVLAERVDNEGLEINQPDAEQRHEHRHRGEKLSAKRKTARRQNPRDD